MLLRSAIAVPLDRSEAFGSIPTWFVTGAQMAGEYLGMAEHTLEYVAPGSEMGNDVPDLIQHSDATHLLECRARKPARQHSNGGQPQQACGFCIVGGIPNS